MPYVIADDGVRVHYRAAGRTQRNDPALIFVHGWCSNLEHWTPVADEFARTHRVVSLDLRGHGRSEAPPRGYTMARFAKDVAAVAQAANATSAVVIGHSMGGIIALQAARRHRALVRAIVMVDSILKHYSPASRLHELPLYRDVSDPPGNAGIGVLYARFFGDPRDADFGALVTAEASRTPRHIALAALRGLLTTNVPAVAKGVRQPALFINASTGNQRTAADFTAVFPHGAFAQAALAGHFVQLEAPDQVSAMIRRFLARLD
jgi:pimeloyl-ACP methyl ester carboxylesterase